MKRQISSTPSAELGLSLREQAHRAGREMSARSVMFYTLVAERLGLSVSDLRAWDLLLRYGSMSASQFADLTGLTPGAVTGLVDRLGRAGAVKRTPDPHDRRKVIITVTSALRTGKTSVYFDSFQAALARLYKRYSDDEIRVIYRYSTEIAALLQEEALRLRSSRLGKRKRN
jgi:DNA-binding MarR family transcriptional regulator